MPLAGETRTRAPARVVVPATTGSVHCRDATGVGEFRKPARALAWATLLLLATTTERVVRAHRSNRTHSLGDASTVS